MSEINAADWLAAVDAHPETIDRDLVVAAAIAGGETSVDGMPQQDVDDSIEELVGLGFLEVVFSASCSGGCAGTLSSRTCSSHSPAALEE